MKRVVVIGQPGQRGPLTYSEFARLMAQRLGMSTLPAMGEAAPQRSTVAVDAATPRERTASVGRAETLAADSAAPAKASAQVQPRENDSWVAAEPAGIFSEDVFRHADTVVWLHFSPAAFVRDWMARWRTWWSSPASAEGRTGLRDIYLSFRFLLKAPHLYRLLHHPALAHVSFHVLRTPEQARFWLSAQEQRLRANGRRND